MGGRLGLLILAFVPGWIGAPGASPPGSAGLALEGAMQQEPGSPGFTEEELLARLEAAPAESFGAVLGEVFESFTGSCDRHDYATGLLLARAMRAEAERRGPRFLRTRIWASSTLGLALTRAGEHAAAEATVSEEIAALRAELARLTETLSSENLAPEPEAELRAWREALRIDLVALRDRRALARLGAGWTSGARADLGAALAGGSRDAVLVLGRLELREGRIPLARQLLGSLLSEGAGEAWARRGWGLTMLP